MQIPLVWDLCTKEQETIFIQIVSWKLGDLYVGRQFTITVILPWGTAQSFLLTTELDLVQNLTKCWFHAICRIEGRCADEQFLLWLFCKAAVILPNHWKLIMFAVVIVSHCLLCLSVFMRHVFPAPNHPLPQNSPVRWRHLSAVAGGWCVSRSMWLLCQSRQSKSLIPHFPASKSSLQASALSHLDHPSPPSSPLWDGRSLMSDKVLGFNPKRIQD